MVFNGSQVLFCSVFPLLFATLFYSWLLCCSDLGDEQSPLCSFLANIIKPPLGTGLAAILGSPRKVTTLRIFFSLLLLGGDIHPNPGPAKFPCEMDMIILDFSKAFDKVPHQRLISKLQFYGIQGGTLMWITSRSQSVIIDGVCSKSVDVTSGVPQGTVLGPLMFLLFINDMQDDLECTLRLFADDALLYHKIT